MILSIKALEKIETTLLDLNEDELVEVFIYVDSQSISRLKAYLHSLDLEVTAGSYTPLGLILTRLRRHDMEKLADRDDVIKIYSQGEIALEQEQLSKTYKPTDQKKNTDTLEEEKK